MAKQELAKARTHIRVSSSVKNFEKGILYRFHAPNYMDFTGKPVKWGVLRSRGVFSVFVGMYHIGDYWRYFAHRGVKAVIWCGSDILNLRWPWNLFLRKGIHFCENDVERQVLLRFGIDPIIQPFYFGDGRVLKSSFFPSNRPQVYLSCRTGREKEYGVDRVLAIAHLVPEVTFHIYGVAGDNLQNVLFHGKVSEERFLRDIKTYHAALRLNMFDGFGDVTAKSVLLGQYPITSIPYPKIDHARNDDELVELLRKLKYKKKPNYEAREYWIKILCPEV